ncbi:MAG: GSCFA domain-containing protein [Paludibacter sp.]
MFQTKIDINPPSFKIKPDSRLLSIGSCFSENIGKKLADIYFDIQINPTGIVFNPASVFKSVEMIIDGKLLTESDLFYRQNKWGSYLHSTQFSDENSQICLDKINHKLTLANRQLKTSNFLIITFGTAWVYKLKATNEIVSNCHKHPSGDFIRERLSAKQIVELAHKTLAKLEQFNPGLNIIFAVSPVRHIKDGATENNISKGLLLQAVQELTQTNANYYYFPSYEIQLDELRDYRFYADDMLHPSTVAIDYIFKRFKDNLFDKNTQEYSELTTNYSNAINHKAENTNTSEYEKFMEYTIKLRAQLAAKFPHLERHFAFG